MERTESGDIQIDLEPLSDISGLGVWDMIEALPDGVLLADGSGRIVAVNSQLEEIFGLDRADILGRPVEELIPERFGDVHRAHRERYRADPVVRAMGVGLDLWGRRGDGAEFPIEVSLSPLATESGPIVVATVRDIGDRRAAEADRLAIVRALDAALDGVFIFDAESLLFTYVNEGAVAQLGYRSDELASMTPLDIKPEFTGETFRALVAPLLSDEHASVELTTTHRRRDGVEIPVEVELTMAPAISGQRRQMIAVARDISERIRREAAESERQIMVELQRDRERLAGDLHDLVIQRLFGAGMGLQAVQTLALEPMVADRVAHTVAELDQAIAELRSAIFHLTTPQHTTLRVTLEHVITEGARRIGFDPEVDIRGDLESVPPEVSRHLVAVLTEVLSNVARHAEANRLRIGLFVESDEVELVVEDDGKGMEGAGTGEGMGNLARRARELDGTFIVTQPEAPPGTKVIWTARLDNSAPRSR